MSLTQMIYITFDNTVWSGLVWSGLSSNQPDTGENWRVYCLLLGNLSKENNQMNFALDIAPESGFLAPDRPSSATVTPL